MINRSELALLKTGSLLDQMQQASGMSITAMEQEVERRAIAAMERMKDLDIPFPHPVGNVQIVSMSKTMTHYRAVRSLAGKGIGAKNRIRFNVLSSIGIEQDDRLWRHVSFTRLDRKMPTYQDTAFIKGCFFANDWAIQLFPQAEHHVSDHDTCLHLWSCLEHNPLPDFRIFGTI